MSLFSDRSEAGRFLAGKLSSYAGDPDVFVLALPRGGVPIAYEVARALKVPWDVFLVRKLGVPGHEELAMGAIASGGVCFFNRDIVQGLHIPREAIEKVIREEEEEMRRRENLYRRHDPLPPLEGRKVILIDDGLATGASMKAAVAALRQLKPAKIVVAVPVASTEACDELLQEADEVVCGERKEPFYGVGYWYRDFSQVSDDEVVRLLDERSLTKKGVHYENRQKQA